MKKFKIHLALLSDQMVPNVIPALDDAIKPDKIILCESDSMKKKEKAEILSKFFKTKNIETECVSMGNAYDFEEMQNIFTKIAERNSNEELAINLTGGTKLMSIAAQNIFSVCGGYTCFYVVPKEDKIVVFDPGVDNVSEYFLKDQIKLNDYFKIHGYDVISKKTAKGFKPDKNSIEITEKISRHSNIYTLKSISKLNKLATNRRELNSLAIKPMLYEEDEPLFELFCDHNYIDEFDGNFIKFSDKKSREYCGGIWLEEYIHLGLSKIKDTFQDFATSVEIIDQNGTKNELDAVFIYRNNLYILEAKTALVDKKGSDFIYKIDSLKSRTGLYTTPIIVSLRVFKKEEKQRAEKYGIKLIETHDITKLDEKIKDILGIKETTI